MKKQRGFTLVELIVVIAILVVLAAILIPVIGGYINQAETTECRANMATVRRMYAAECALAQGAGAGTDELLRQALTQANEPAAAAAANSEYKAACGGDCAVTYSADRMDVSNVYCTRHGWLYTAERPAGLMSSPAGNLQDALANAIATKQFGYGGRVDSTAGSVTYQEAMRKYLAKQGVDLETLGVVSWAVIREGGADIAFWTDQDISTVAEGSYVRVVRYNPTQNTYTAGYMLVDRHSDLVANSTKEYQVFAGGAGSNVWKQADGQTADTKADYTQTVAIFNQMDASVTTIK